MTKQPHYGQAFREIRKSSILQSGMKPVAATCQQEDPAVRTDRAAIHPGEHLTGEPHHPDHKRPGAIIAETAPRLGRCFNTGPRLWPNLQQLYESRRAQQPAGAAIGHPPAEPVSTASLKPRR